MIYINMDLQKKMLFILTTSFDLDIHNIIQNQYIYWN